MRMSNSEFVDLIIDGCRKSENELGTFRRGDVFRIATQKIGRNPRFYRMFDELIASGSIVKVIRGVYKLSDALVRVENTHRMAKIEKEIVRPMSVTELAKMAIEHLNLTTGKKYKVTPKVVAQVSSRYSEGFRGKDFIAVIENKWIEWKGSKMEIYVRPSTLFGTKFQDYLNQENKQQRMENMRFDSFFK